MFTPIELDKVRNFRYGMKAVALVERKLKTSIGKIDMDSLTMDEMAIILWAGLVHEDKDLTPDKIMDLVDNHSSVTKAMELMSEAFTAAFNSGDEPAKNV